MTEKFPLCFACAVIAALLIGHSTNTYDLCWLVVPAVLGIDYCVREFRSRDRRCLSVLVAAIPLLISPLWFILWMRWERIHVMAIFLVWWWFAMRSEAMASRAPSAIPVSA